MVEEATRRFIVVIQLWGYGSEVETLRGIYTPYYFPSVFVSTIGWHSLKRLPLNGIRAVFTSVTSINKLLLFEILDHQLLLILDKASGVCGTVVV